MRLRHVLAAVAMTALCADATTGSLGNVIPRIAILSESSDSLTLTCGKPVEVWVQSGLDTMRCDFLANDPELFRRVPAAKKALVRIRPDRTLPTQGYSIHVTKRGIDVNASSGIGAMYALQSLLQATDHLQATSLQCGTATDAPRFAYRGLLFDVSRHFRSIDFLKKQIRAMAALKLNVMHLHLTDGAGWRMEIKAFPRLTEYAAWRPQATWQEWSDNGAHYCEHTDAGAQGGFYTQDQLRDLSAYALSHGITVIPEIEIPGHSREVTSAYPWLGCSGKPESDEDVCIGSDSTFMFFEQVLREVADVFPSHYIHIGGDEATKQAWKTCPRCQKRMSDHGFSGVDSLQSYAIHRVERFVNDSLGRSIIGWDEILQGGVAPNATLMSWRGTKGGIEALKSGHKVVMTPVETCYIDYTQDASFKEPASIGGYTPLQKVYEYEPLPDGLTTEQGENLLGVQANLWSEYVPTDSHAEYMYYPRALALAEIAWSSASGKDYDKFRTRALHHTAHLRSQGYNTFDLANEFGQRPEALTPVSHSALGAKVHYTIPYHNKYRALSDTTLVDGLRGGWTYGSDNRWQGFLGDFDATVELSAQQPLHSVSIAFMHAPGAWVHLPKYVEVLTSADGSEYSPVETMWSDIDPNYPKIAIRTYTATIPQDTRARYVRIKAKGHDRPGAWLFTDEIIVK